MHYYVKMTFIKPLCRITYDIGLSSNTATDEEVGLCRYLSNIYDQVFDA